MAEDVYFYTILFILVAISSFGLGRQSVTEGNGAVSNPVLQPYPVVRLEPSISQTTGESADSLVVVASKSGTKYHLPTCPGAKQIKESNVIEFLSIQAAEAAGYTPAANCKF